MDPIKQRYALAGICRVVKPHGALLSSKAEMYDQLDTFGRTLYGASTMHCLAVSLAEYGEGLRRPDKC